MLLLLFAAGFYLVDKWMNPRHPPPPPMHSDAGLPIDALEEGQVLYDQYCHACHGLHKTDNMLLGFAERSVWADDPDNLRKFIRDPAAFIPTTYYTQELLKQYGQVMPGFPQLTDHQLSCLIRFMRDTLN